MSQSTQQLVDDFRNQLLYRKKDLEESIPSLRDLSLIPIAEAMKLEINRIDKYLNELQKN